MKKLLFLIISFLFVVPCVYALDTEVSSIEYKTKSDNMIRTDDNISGNTITPDITFDKINDEITYDITITNKDGKKYKIVNVTDDNKDENISLTYSYDTTMDTNDKVVSVTLKYTKKIYDELSLDDIKITIELIDEDEEKGVLNEIITNPSTGDKLLLFVSLFAITLIIILGITYKREVLLFIIPIILIMPFIINAKETSTEEVYIKGSDVKINLYTAMFLGGFDFQLPIAKMIGDYEEYVYYTIELLVYDENGNFYSGYSNNYLKGNHIYLYNSLLNLPEWYEVDYFYDQDTGDIYYPDSSVLVEKNTTIVASIRKITKENPGNYVWVDDVCLEWIEDGTYDSNYWDEDMLDEYCQWEYFYMWIPVDPEPYPDPDPFAPSMYAFLQSEELKDDSLILSNDEYDYPIYFWYEEDDEGNMLVYYYTDANLIYLPPDSAYQFYGTNSLKDISGLEKVITDKVEIMDYMFGGTGLEDISILSDWNTSNVISIQGMFAYTQNINNFDVLSNFDVSNVTDMSYIFYGTSISDLTPLSNWDTSNVKYMYDAFGVSHNIASLKGLENWDTSSVENTQYMFFEVPVSDLTPLSNWDTSNVKYMDYMFAYNESLTNLNGLENWDTSNVTSFISMFFDNTNLTDVSAIKDWDVSSGIEFWSMFASCADGDFSPLSGWDVSGIRLSGQGYPGLQGMFRGITNKPTFTKLPGYWRNDIYYKS